MPLSGSLEHLASSHKIPYIPAISWHPATTCDSPSPPHFCHLLAALDSSQPLLSFLQLLPLFGSSRYLATALLSPLISATTWQLSVDRDNASPLLMSAIPLQPVITHDNPTLSHHLYHFLVASRGSSPPLTPTLGEKLTITLDSHTPCPHFCYSRTAFDGPRQPLPFSYFCNLWPAHDNLRQPRSSPPFLLPTTIYNPSLFSHLYYSLADVGGLRQTPPSSHSCHSQADHYISRQYSPFPSSTLLSGISWQPLPSLIFLPFPSELR